MLISRTASLAKLHHQPKGYSGPLSRHLLSYNSIVSSLQSSLRDLVEMSLATMFLEGHVNRERSDWMDLSLGYNPRSFPHICLVHTLISLNIVFHFMKSDPVLSGSSRWLISMNFAHVTIQHQNPPELRWKSKVKVGSNIVIFLQAWMILSDYGIP